MTDQHLTHIDENGAVRMVDVSQKADTERVAVRSSSRAKLRRATCWRARAWPA